MDNPSPTSLPPRHGSSGSRRRSSLLSDGGYNAPMYHHEKLAPHSNDLGIERIHYLTKSSPSFVSDVEMAHDEVFAGPISESVPSSVTGFAHRHSRADSVASFTYFQEEDEVPEYPSDEAIVDDSDEEFEGIPQTLTRHASTSFASIGRKSSDYSSVSVDNPLLHRHDSTRTDVSFTGRVGRRTQRIYVATEDLTIVVAGFSSRPVGLAAYTVLCVLSLGFAYLLLRWLPRWRVRLIGLPTSLQYCTWVVVEVSLYSSHMLSQVIAKMNQNQWGEFSVQNIAKSSYGHSLSTVFGTSGKLGYHECDEYDDPVLAELRFLDYRYIRFYFHPLKDRFMLCTNWKDPRWADFKFIRMGLDSDERYRREQVFGKNDIDIEQKSVPQLLVDEASIVLLLLVYANMMQAFHPFYVFQVASLILWSLDESVRTGADKVWALLNLSQTMRRLREISRFECEAEKEGDLLHQPSAVRRKPPFLILHLIIDSVNVGGKLDVMCFDKTGTLTEDGLDVLGIRVVNRPAMR
ncbi:MAG: hypothetical protein Q9195_006154 [Heterodermia aff. obscurata]